MNSSSSFNHNNNIHNHSSNSLNLTDDATTTTTTITAAATDSDIDLENRHPVPSLLVPNDTTTPSSITTTNTHNNNNQNYHHHHHLHHFLEDPSLENSQLETTVSNICPISTSHSYSSSSLDSFSSIPPSSTSDNEKHPRQNLINDHNNNNNKNINIINSNHNNNNNNDDSQENFKDTEIKHIDTITPPPEENNNNNIIYTNKLHDPTYFPDGGIRAWLCLIGGFLSVFNTWGVITSFGVFQSYYRTVLLTSSSSFQLGWISSLQLSCIFMGGVITGRPFDAGYFYVLEAIGSILIFVSFMLLAECTEYYQVLLAQGIGMGLGMGVLFGPCLACTSAYFKRYRGFAMCVCAGGGGFGGVIFPIAANNLLEKIGFPWTMRVLAFIELFCLLIMCAVMRDKLPFKVRQQFSKQKNTSSIFSLDSWIDKSALKSPEFMFFVVGVTFCFFALYTPFAQLQSYAIHIDADPTITRYIISILNSTSTIARLSVFLIARYLGALNMTVVFSILAAASCYSLFTVDSNAGLVIFALAYGFLAGVIGTFPPFVVPHLTEDITRLGVRFGMCFLCLCLFLAFSVPLSGLTLGSNGTNYMHMSMFCGTLFIGGAIFMTLGRVGKGGLNWKII